MNPDDRNPSSWHLEDPAQDYILDEAPPPLVKKKHPFTRWWEKVGGGSLTVSIIVHAVFLLIAFIYIVNVISQEKKVDFLPGGSAAGKSASSDLAAKTSSKRKSAMKPSVPAQKIVTSNENAAIALPEATADLVDMPDMPSMTGGGMGGGIGSGAGGGNGGMGGIGTGFGSGIGMGNASGFVATAFGRLGGEGLPGTLYDLKQKPSRAPTEFVSADANTQETYAEVIKRAARQRFTGGVLKDYFSSTQKMTFTFLAVPNDSAEAGPKAFRVEKEVNPKAWFVHYSGNIAAPTPGDWRFVGIFDDALIVYINNKPVLDGSWYSLLATAEKRPDEDIRQEMTNSVQIFPAKRHLYVGKWVKMTNTMKIDIVVGERPGGLVGGVLLVEKKGEKYEMRPDGSPILPIFTTSELDGAAVKRLYDFSQGEPALQFAKETPVFEVKKDFFDKGPGA